MDTKQTHGDLKQTINMQAGLATCSACRVNWGPNPTATGTVMVMPTGQNYVSTCVITDPGLSTQREFPMDLPIVGQQWFVSLQTNPPPQRPTNAALYFCYYTSDGDFLRQRIFGLPIVG
jgi:hypothetical protein